MYVVSVKLDLKILKTCDYSQKKTWLFVFLKKDKNCLNFNLIMHFIHQFKIKSHILDWDLFFLPLNCQYQWQEGVLEFRVKIDGRQTDKNTPPDEGNRSIEYSSGLIGGVTVGEGNLLFLQYG